jgi:hypothetical protein
MAAGVAMSWQRKWRHQRSAACNEINNGEMAAQWRVNSVSAKWRQRNNRQYVESVMKAKSSVIISGNNIKMA